MSGDKKIALLNRWEKALKEKILDVNSYTIHYMKTQNYFNPSTLTKTCYVA